MPDSILEIDSDTPIEGLIRIAIVDDHPAYCESMKTLFENYPEIRVVFVAHNGRETLEKLKIKRPDIILMDLDMPEMDGEEAFDLISAQYPEVSVIINTSHFTPSLVLRFLKKRVPAFIGKTWLSSQIITAIKTVHLDGRYYDKTVADIMQKSIYDSARDPSEREFPDVNLSVQELQVFKLMCMSYSTQDIAQKLNRSIKTIEGIRSSVWEKTGVPIGNIAELILWGLRRGVLAIL